MGVDCLDIAFKHEYEGQYPRLYVFQRYEHVWLSHYLQFYVVPWLMNIMLVLVHPGYTDTGHGTLVDVDGEYITDFWQPTGKHIDNNEAVSFSATIVLACVAMLYTASQESDGGVFNYNQKMVLYNM